MLGKLIGILAVLALILLDTGQRGPDAYAPAVIARIQLPMFATMERVRADLKANGRFR